MFDVLFFFFKQKTAYEMRISDWSSDVCSSDLALRALEADPEASLLVLPSDHIVGNVATFQSAVARAVEATRQGYFVAFGMTITQPETGYGYIRQGNPFDSIEGCWIAERFVEKPERATGDGFEASGGYSWNSGLFALSAAKSVAALE